VFFQKEIQKEIQKDPGKCQGKVPVKADNFSVTRANLIPPVLGRNVSRN